MLVDGNYPDANHLTGCRARAPKGGWLCGRPREHPGSHMSRSSKEHMAAIWDSETLCLAGVWYKNERIERTVLDDNWVLQ